MSFEAIRNTEQVRPPVDFDSQKTKGVAERTVPPDVRKSDSSAERSQSETQVAPRDAVERAVQKLNDSAAAQGRRLSYRIDASTKRVVVQIINKETNEVIRQIPVEEALHIAQQLDHLRGMMLNENS
jgi:flagellar protein FlaG